MSIDIKTVVIHCKKLQDRKQSIINQFIKHNFTNYSFYEQYDAVELTPDLIETLYTPKSKDSQTWANKVGLWGPAALHYHAPVCNLAEISLTIKFGKIFQELSTQEFDYCLIFEDDVLLTDNFGIKFNEYLSKTPHDWDAIYFGSCANLKPQGIIPDKIAYVKSHPASRGGDSTLLKKKTITDLAKTWFPFNLISDWELGYQHYLHNHKVYWWEPSLVKQGSETGIFASELR